MFNMDNSHTSKSDYNEWVELMRTAKESGLTVKQVREFLEKKKAMFST
ncbi:anti-repressor SinI family protein [Salipaludibacillus aurantiacus]|uniref:Anti-repressor SinI n=1 Tax=Salipaludibacillus aurantiacus TaxID=1601833 RepID=A0A1H9R8Z3_9BACI|nr:anti-repressor SinI family protein [Salipaludibacillus aurantiacus]SER69140.1 Anti-repressor SinI [Salipaludibacillus aurantiacus]